MADMEYFLNIFHYDGSIPIKMSITNNMVPNTIMSLGTEQHRHFLTEFTNGNVCTNMTQSHESLL